MLIIPKSWEDEWKGKDIFRQIFSFSGKIYKDKDNRKTFSFSFKNKHYFAKLHHGVGWKKIIKYLFQFRLPVLTAESEWSAIQKLEKLNIKTTPLVAYGKKGRNPAKIKSFVITEALTNTISLQNFCKKWTNSPPNPKLKRALITKVAEISRTLHENGFIHRDFYICHFLLQLSEKKPLVDPENLCIHLIDLHRVRQYPNLQNRLKTKEIGGLYFSAMDIGLTNRDIFRFMRVYRNTSLRETLHGDRSFWKRAKRRGNTLYQKFS